MRCYNKLIHLTYRSLLPTSLMMLLSMSLFAEGIRQVAPTAGDAPVMLETGNEDFGNFASPNGEATSRLLILVGHPDEEIHLGLAPEYDDDGNPFINDIQSRYRFQIRRALGNSNMDPIVHGPFTVDNTNANVNSWADALYGVYPETREENGQLVYVFAPGEVGNYYIEFFEPTGAPDAFLDPEVNIPFWDFTVVRDGEAQDGRVWSRNWAFRTPQVDGTEFPTCVWDREFNGQLYSYTEDGFVSLIDFNGAGMQGLSFNVAFNSTGAGGTGDLLQDRMSIPNENRTDNSAQHRIFLMEPDPEFFPDGDCGDVIIPSNTFRCTGNGDFCLDISVTKPGQVEVIIDFNQNNVLDNNSEDVSIRYEFTELELSACIPWDGMRGDGTMIDFGDTVNLIVNYSQGIQHWSVFDVEFMRNGFCVETIRPKCTQGLRSNTLYWDDRNIPEDPGTGAAKDQRAGCDCNDGCRSWNNFSPGSNNSCTNFDDELTSGYGDKSTLNTWWFANDTTIIQVNIPLVQAFISGLDTICPAEQSTLTALDAGAVAPLMYNWSGPGVDNMTTQSVVAMETGEYCVTITDALGCSNATCQTFTVLDDSALDVTYMDIEACPGDLVTLVPIGDTSQVSFSWEPAVIFDDPNSPSPSLTYFPGLNATVTITSPEGCTKTETINLNSSIIPIPAFETTQGCENGLEILFNNTTSDGIDYSWDFGDPNTTTDTSSEINPTYTYPETGTYQVQLTATSADGCSTTLTQNVEVSTVVLAADFEVVYRECTAIGAEIEFRNTTQSGYPGDLSYSWTFTNFPSSNLENPVFNIMESQTITAVLTVLTDNGCAASSIQQDINLIIGPPNDQFPDNIIACTGEATTLMPAGDPNLTYTWSPTIGIDLTNPAQPIFSPDETTIYTVVVSAGNEVCSITEVVVVEVPPVIGIDIDGDGVTCEPSATLSVSTVHDATIQWVDPITQAVLANGNTFTVDVSGSTAYTVLATDASGCVEASTATVSGGPVDVEVADTVAVCLGQEILLNVNNLDSNDTLTYSWTPEDLFAPGTAAEAMPDYLESVGVNDVSVVVTNQFNCTTTENVHIAVIDPNIDLSFTSMIDCNGSVVSFTNTSTDAFGYVWDFGDGSARSVEVNPTHQYASPGDYTVTLSIIYDVDCVVPFSQVISVEEPQIEADFTYDIVECAPTGATIQFMDATTNTLDNTISWNWTFSNATPASSTLQNPSVTIDGSGPLLVELIIGTANICTDTIERELDIQLVDLDISLTDTIIACLGSFEVLNPNGNPDYIYQWTPAEGLSDPTAVSPRAAPNETTTYRVTAFNTVGADTCFVMDSVVLFVPPPINLGVDQSPVVTTCGEDVVINATADATVDVVWTNSSGVIGTGPTLSWNPFRRDTITATATDAFGCEEIAQVIIIDEGVDVFDLPDGIEIDACTFIPTTLEVTNLDDMDILTYDWGPSDLIDGPTDQASVNIVPTMAGEFTLSVIVENQNACLDTVDFLINVFDFDGTVSDTLFVCYDTPTPLNPDGNPDYTYNWSPATGLSSTTDFNPTVTLTEDQLYLVTITDPTTDCVNTDSLQVIVLPNINLQVSGDTTLCEPSSVTLSATTDFPTNIVWTLNGQTIGTGNSVDFTPPAEDTYVITATATDPDTDCAMSASVTVVFDLLEDVLPESPLRICPGEPTAINPNGNSNLIYEWSPQDEAIDLSTPWNPIVTTTTPRTYTVIVTDNQRVCSISAEIEIQVEDALDLGINPEVCYDTPTPLNPNGNPDYMYNWSPATGLSSMTSFNPTATLTEDQLYLVTITNPMTNCVTVDSVQVTVLPNINLQLSGDTTLCEPSSVNLSATTDFPTDIVWTLNGETIGTGDNIDFMPPAEGAYTITATATDTNTDCTTSATVTVVFDPLEDVLPEDPIRICPGEPTAINPNGNPDLIYEWSPQDEAIDLSTPWNPVVTTTIDRIYSVTVTDSQRACTISAEIEIQVEDALDLDVSPETVNHCGGELELNATTAITATINWFLLPDNTPLGSGNVLTFVPPLGTSQIYAEAVSSANCTARDTVLVNNYPINANLAPELFFCVPTDTTSLTVFNNDPAQDLSIVWEPTGVLTNPAIGPTVVVDPNITNRFTATVTNQFGCSLDLSTTVTVIDLEGDLSISADPTELVMSETSVITVTGCDNCTYEWFPPSGETVFPNDGPQVETTPNSDGELVYTVIVSQDGCEQELSITLSVLNAICDTEHLFFPNAFTPNNDGDNDVLRLRSNFLDDLLEVEWMVYNRWGEEIFRTTNPRAEWDGTYRNEQLAPDVYGYWLRILCPNEEELIQKGNVTLLR